MSPSAGRSPGSQGLVLTWRLTKMKVFSGLSLGSLGAGRHEQYLQFRKTLPQIPERPRGGSSQPQGVELNPSADSIGLNIGNSVPSMQSGNRRNIPDALAAHATWTSANPGNLHVFCRPQLSSGQSILETHSSCTCEPLVFGGGQMGMAIEPTNMMSSRSPIFPPKNRQHLKIHSWRSRHEALTLNLSGNISH